MPERRAAPALIAIFGPTAVGKTGVALELADLLRAGGADPVAVNCDSIQVYRGLETLSGAASEAERRRLEHRLLSFVAVEEEFSAGRFATLARAEIDSLLAAGRTPIVVGGTGLYMRAALSELDLRPPVPEEIRERVEREIAANGPEALHAEIPPDLARAIHPNDRQRVARSVELVRAGLDPAPDHAGGGELWTARLRHPTLLIGIAVGPQELASRIDARVEEMVVAGAVEEARAAAAGGPSRTAAAALGFDQLIDADVEGVKAAHRRYARRQMTWMRRMEGVEVLERDGRSDSEVAGTIESLLRDTGPR